MPSTLGKQNVQPQYSDKYRHLLRDGGWESFLHRIEENLNKTQTSNSLQWMRKPKREILLFPNLCWPIRFYLLHRSFSNWQADKAVRQKCCYHPRAGGPWRYGHCIMLPVQMEGGGGVSDSVWSSLYGGRFTVWCPYREGRGSLFGTPVSSGYGSLYGPPCEGGGSPYGAPFMVTHHVQLNCMGTPVLNPLYCASPHGA